MTNAERDTLILQWRAAKSSAVAAVEKEMNLRLAIVEKTFDPDKVKGTENIELGQGWKLKAVKKQNYNLKGSQQEIVTALSGMSAEIQKRLVKWSPKLSLTEYKLLEEKDLAAIDKVVVVTPATPTLELVEPKKK